MDKKPLEEAPRKDSQKVIYAAIVANLGIAVAKFIVAAITGSAAMVAEGIHSAVDTGNEFLLLLGERRAARPADRKHPFGYGKSVYFWALIVALSVFSLGGGLSIYHGIEALQNPPRLEDPTWNYVVLAVAALSSIKTVNTEASLLALTVCQSVAPGRRLLFSARRETFQLYPSNRKATPSTT